MAINKTDNKIIFYFDIDIVQAFAFTESTDEKQQKIVSTTKNVFLPGEKVARIIPPSDPRFLDPKFDADYLKSDFVQKDTKNVIYNSQTQEYIAAIYGFAKLVNHREIVIEPLIEYSKDCMKAFMYISRSASNRWPNLDNLKKVYEAQQIVFPLEDSHVRPHLDRLIQEGKSGSKILVAEGTAPKPGRPEIIELKKEMTLKIGKMDETGRIDYKEKDSFIMVTEGEVIAEILPEVPPEDGVDVFGKEIPAKIEGENPYKIGANVSKDPENPSTVIATSDGVLEIDEDGRIHVENKLTIEGNVNLETGNIHFPGTVEINGSVEPGFIVEADGNILIKDNVEDAKIISKGNVIIQNGIIGKEKVSVRAEGSIKCKFTQNANIRAGKDIFISESAIQTKGFAKESIQVSGSIIGGDLIARRYMIVDTAGSSSYVKTHLTAGRDPEIEEKINEIVKKHSGLSKELKDIIEELTQYFGEDFMKNIKAILPTLPKHRKVTALKLIKRMSIVNNEITKYKAEREKLKNQLYFDEPPYIEVKDSVFPEVYIRVHSSVKKIDKKIPTKALFKEDPHQKVIFWD
jgi:uncharacterized protein